MGGTRTRAIFLVVLAFGLTYADREGRADRAPSPEDTLLQEAESLAAQGRYAKAVAAYRRIAKEHPDTEAGRVAESRSAPSAYLGWSTVLRHGPSENRLDIVVMGDGYRLKDQKKFDRTAAEVPTLFKRHHVLGAYLRYHNFHKANLVSADSHVDANGREFDTALDGRAGGGQQGQVEVDPGLVRSFLEHVPDQEGLAIAFVQRGTLGTGGGGTAIIGGQSPDMLFHEWGHGFGDLGDEYAATTGGRKGFREAPNVSETDDPDLVPWKHWLDARVRGVGVYEGALGQVRGAWKPTNRCAMASGTDFCVVCREVLVLNIYRRVDPIDGATPEPHPLDTDEAIRVQGPVRFEVRVLEPTTHGLEAAWWVLPEAEVPEDPTPRASMGGEGDRRARGPLLPIDTEPVHRKEKPKRGIHAFELDPEGLAPGRYRVVCRVSDPAKGRGDRHPWVMKDPHGLLQSERAWWIRLD